MKQVYLLRHAEKEPGIHGLLTDPGKQAAAALGAKLPDFIQVFSSESERARLTARLITGKEPTIVPEAMFYTASADISKKLAELAQNKGVSFSEAVELLDDQETRDGVQAQARQLNQLIDTLLGQLKSDETALVVSHDMTITPAMVQRGLSFEPIPFLGGYAIREDGTVSKLTV